MLCKKSYVKFYKVKVYIYFHALQLQKKYYGRYGIVMLVKDYT